MPNGTGIDDEPGAGEMMHRTMCVSHEHNLICRRLDLCEASAVRVEIAFFVPWIGMTQDETLAIDVEAHFCRQLAQPDMICRGEDTASPVCPVGGAARCCRLEIAQHIRIVVATDNHGTEGLQPLADLVG